MSTPADDPIDVSPMGERARIVLFSLLSRADTTPLQARSRAEGHVLDKDGRIVPDPAAGSVALALEPDPNLGFEHWGAYWRKVHGARFIYADSVREEATLAKLLRYNQIHRVAAGPSSSDAMPYRPPLDAAGELFDTIIGHVAQYRRPRWDGVAYLQFSSEADLREVLGSERVRLKILPEDRAIFRDLAPLLARQHVLSRTGDGSDAVVLVKTHSRRGELDRADFQHAWLHGSGPRIAAEPDVRRFVRRYVQLHNIGPVERGSPFFHPETADVDGVTLMAFATMRDVEAFLLSEGHSVVTAAEGEITRAGSGEFWTGIDFTVVDGQVA